MADTDRGGDGQVRSGVSEEELLAAVRVHAPATTREVADEISMPQEETDQRLQDLREEGQVDSTTIATSFVWVDPAERTHEQSTAWRDLFDEDFTLTNADR